MESSDILEILKSFANENKGTIGLYLLFSASFPLSDVVLPYYYGKIIDSVDNVEQVKGYAAKILGIWTVNQGLLATMDYMDSYFIPKLQSYVRQHLVEHIFGSFSENLQDIEVATLLSKIVRLPIILKDLFNQIRSFIIPVTMTLTTASGYFLYVNRNLGIITIVLIGIFFYLAYISLRSCIDMILEYEDDMNELYEDIGDLFNNLISIFSNITTQQELEKMNVRQQSSDSFNMRVLQCSSRFKVLFNLSFIIMLGVINSYAYNLYLTKQIDLGSLTSIFIIVLYIIGQLNKVSEESKEFLFNLGILHQTRGYLRKLGKLKRIIVDGVRRIIREPENLSINLKNLLVKFGDKDLFRNFSYSFPENSRTAIIGEIGTGKSTLFKLILGLNKPNGGEISLGNLKIDPEVIRKYVTFVPQSPALFNRSLYENIVYGIKNVDRQDVISLMNRHNLSKIFGKHKLDDNVGRGGSKLSGGQRQIVYLLRCLLKKTPIILLDEPTSALSSDLRDKVLGILAELFEGKTVLCITHDPDVISTFDRVLDLNEHSKIRE